MKKTVLIATAFVLGFTGLQAFSNHVQAKDNKPSKEERKENRKEKKEERISYRKTADNEVSYQSKEAFYRLYGFVPDVKWIKGKHFDEAGFDMNGVATTAYFDTDAQLVGTTSVKAFTDLPAAAQDQIRKEYADYTIAGVVFFDDNEAIDTNMSLYGNEFDNEDNYFVALKKDGKTEVLQVTTNGLIGFFISPGK